MTKHNSNPYFINGGGMIGGLDAYSFASRHASRSRIQEILETPAQQMSMAEKRKRIETFVYEHELTDGIWLVSSLGENTPYVLIPEKHKVYRMPSSVVTLYLHDKYALNSVDTVAKAVMASMTSMAAERGLRVALRRFAAFDEDVNELYITRYNGLVYLITGKEIMEVPNCTNFLFADDDGGEDVEVPDIFPHGQLLPYLTGLSYSTETVGGITPAQQCMALTVWLFAAAFPDLIRAKPLLMIEGGSGSGKSTAARRIQHIIHGKESPMILAEDGQDDFGVQLLRNPIAVFDNTDEHIKWLADAFAAYVTGAEFKKRKLYTDDEEHVIRASAFVIIASKDPRSFRREDIVDRSIIIRLDRRDDGKSTGFVPDNVLYKEAIERRPQLFGEYLYYVNLIVAAIRNGRWTHYADKVSLFHRMGDYAQMAFIVGEILGWEYDDIAGMFAALRAERDAMIMEDDPLVDTLNDWLEHASKAGRYFTLTMLFNELNATAQGVGRQFYHSERLLGQKLRSPHLKDFFQIDIRVEQGRRHRVYAFHKLGEAWNPKAGVPYDADGNELEFASILPEQLDDDEVLEVVDDDE